MNTLKSSLPKVLLSLITISCIETKTEEQVNFDFYSSQLFEDVQLSTIFSDAKTFTDCVPKKPLADINTSYILQKKQGNVNLEAFVSEYFEMPDFSEGWLAADTNHTITEHILKSWSALMAKHDHYSPFSSLIPLPHDYPTPGGKFREMHYWHSYFILEGLLLSGQQESAKKCVDNFTFLIDSIGFIPQGNRTYYLGRSNPPFFAVMVELLAAKDRDLYSQYLPHLVKEYDFWMDGSEKLSHKKRAYRRVVRMSDGSILNRYWDDLDGPRPETFSLDFKLGAMKSETPDKLYKNLRAASESGWNNSSRWLADHEHLSTIRTTDIIPVDLNSLLYFLELKIAQGYNWKGELRQTKVYLEKANARKEALIKYLWDDQDLFFIDYDFRLNKKTGVLSLAGAFPLYFKIASKTQAKPVLDRLKAQFLKTGGFRTTLKETGQPWDAPRGFAPLQWIAINAFYNYGEGKLGNEAAKRWLGLNKAVYHHTGKTMEKYDVTDSAFYLQDNDHISENGFSWTHGVFLALQNILTEEQMIEEMRVTNESTHHRK